MIGMTKHYFSMATHQPLSHTLYATIAQCHMIVTDIPHGMNLIGALAEEDGHN